MKKIFLFLFFLFIGICISIGGLWKFFLYQNDRQHAVVLQDARHSTYSVKNAPSQSIKGTILSLSGDIGWESRTATTPASITQPQVLQQGESIITKDTGNVLVQFPSMGLMTIYPNSTLDIIQTLPGSSVFQQDRGSIEYNKTGSIPIAVRSLHLLVQNAGDSIISIDTEKALVTVTVKKGTTQIAYNDLHYMSTVLTIEEGKQLIFHDSTRETQVISSNKNYN